METRRIRRGGLFVGSLSDDDGADTLLEAINLFPGARIAVIDRGDRERMSKAAYLVVPGIHESIPREVIEAFAQGLPVIAARAGMLEELIDPRRNGLLFEPHSARDLARKLAWAEAFPEKIEQLGLWAKGDYQARFIEHWSYQRLFGERRRIARL